MMKLKKSQIAILILFILIVFTGCKKSENEKIIYNKNYVQEINKARKEFSFYIASNFIPGGSIAISKGGKILYSEGIGFASKDLDVPVTRKTKFRIGGVTELFTSLAYELLIKKGTLALDEPIQQYLPEFPEKPEEITLDNLVNHTSGIRQEYSDEEYETNFNINIQQGLDKFKDDPLVSAPGMFQNISSLNYNLLGAVMEKATGKEFKTLINELVIDTLHLENTVFDNPFGPIKNRSNFFTHDIVMATINAPLIDLRSKAPSKGLLSTAEDLVKFGNAFLYSDYITKDLKNEVFSILELDSGNLAKNSNGWHILEDIYGRKVYTRNGIVMGGGATLLIFPEEELVIAILTNLTNDDQQLNKAYDIATYFLPKPETHEQPATEKADSMATE